jgi:hypothetical protein
MGCLSDGWETNAEAARAEGRRAAKVRMFVCLRIKPV